MSEIIINGPEGRLEGKYIHNPNPNSPIALVLHPHPLYGGNMNNKVVYNLYQAFADHGFSVLRINFRGIGKSQGKYDGAIGELNDATVAMDWLQEHNIDTTSCWIAGYSFGAWIAMQLLMRRPEIEGFISVAPPVNMFDFSFVAPCPAAGLIIQGDDDDVVSEDAVSTFVKRAQADTKVSISYSVMGGATHYFKDNYDKLKSEINDYLELRREDIQEKRKIPKKKRRKSQYAKRKKEQEI